MVNNLKSQLSKKFNVPEEELYMRGDGRIEWICEHAVGHTIYVPEKYSKDKSWWSHGCDGCCKIFKSQNENCGDTPSQQQSSGTNPEECKVSKENERDSSDNPNHSQRVKKSLTNELADEPSLLQANHKIEMCCDNPECIVKHIQNRMAKSQETKSANPLKSELDLNPDKDLWDQIKYISNERDSDCFDLCDLCGERTSLAFSIYCRHCKEALLKHQIKGREEARKIFTDYFFKDIKDPVIISKEQFEEVKTKEELSEQINDVSKQLDGALTRFSSAYHLRFEEGHTVIMQEVKEIIKSVMTRYYHSNANVIDLHSRLDELFLLWSSLNKQSFVKSCSDFGINYNAFSNRDYNHVKNQIERFLGSKLLK